MTAAGQIVVIVLSQTTRSHVVIVILMVRYPALPNLGMEARGHGGLHLEIIIQSLILQAKNIMTLHLEKNSSHQMEYDFHIDGQIAVKIREVVGICPVQ